MIVKKAYGGNQMKKKNKNRLISALFLLVVLIVISSCVAGMSDTETEESKNTKEPVVEEAVEEKPEKAVEEPTTEETPAIDEDNFKLISSAVKGGSFLESTTVDGSKATNKYYESFEAYEAASTGSLSADDYKLYFESGDAIEKLLFESTSYLFANEPNLNELTVDFKYADEDYSYTIDRIAAEPYIDADSSDDDMRHQFLKQVIGQEQIEIDNVQ
jgi:hypothetical protein